MANVVAPMGFTPIKSAIGASFVEQGNWYRIPASDTSAYYLGDAVISAVGSDIVSGYPSVAKATGVASEYVRGVVVGVAPTMNLGLGIPNYQGTPLTLEVITVPATKTRDYYVLVLDDPSTLFWIQDNGGGSATAATIAGYASKNCTYTPTAPNSPLPNSATVLNFTTAPATTATLPIKIMGLYQSNAPGGGNQVAQNAKWVVKFNLHELNGAAAGV